MATFFFTVFGKVKVEENIKDSDTIEDKDEYGSEHKTIGAVNLLSHKTKDAISKNS